MHNAAWLESRPVGRDVVLRPFTRPAGDGARGLLVTGIDGESALLLLAEADYRYGAGVLRLRIEQIARAGEVELDGEAWIPVRGMQLRSDGTEVGAVQVLVRATRLRSHQ